MLKMDSSNIATAQYENAVLKAYGIVPMKHSFPGSCNSSVYLKRNQSTLQINHFALSQRKKTTEHESREEHSLSVDETQFLLTMEQTSLNCPADDKGLKITKDDVLKAHGIL